MALSAQQIIEVRATGNAANGGGFGGTDLAGTPSAPAVAGSASGGTVAAGTYYVVLTYTPGGETRESPISAQTAVTATGTTSSITVTSPSDPGGGATWNCYVGTVSGGPYFPQGTGLTVGSPRVITTTPPTTGVQPPGVDYSRQDAAQVSYTDLVIGASTTTLTSAAHPFTPLHVRNLINVASGTGFTVQWLEITGVSAAGVATVDKSAGTANSTGGVGKLGGALDHPATANPIASVTGMAVYVKYSATPYTFTTSLTNGNAHWIGYDTTRTFNNADANRPIWRAGANSITLMTLTQGTPQRLSNIVFDNPSQTFTGCTGAWSNGTVNRCKFSDFTGTAGLLQNGSGALAEDCEFVNVTSTGSLYMNASGNVARRCVFRSSGYVRMVNDSCTLIECVAVSSTGIAYNSFGGQGHQLIRCVSYGAGSNAWTAGSGSGGSVLLDSCVFWGSTTVGAAPGLAARNTVRLVNCRIGGSGTADYDTARIGSDQVTGFVHLTGDPFTNAAAFDFSLNNTAGAGAACKGLSVVFPGGTTTSRPDAGAVQSQGSSGGAALSRVFTGF